MFKIPIIKKILHFVVYPYCVLYLIAVSTISIAGWLTPLKSADVAIVLGTTVHPNGNPSDRLAARLDRAVELYQQNTVPYFIVSGGLGKEGHDEALVMKQYLIAKGIPDSQIEVDSQGFNTARTALFAKQWMQEHQVSRAIMVSQFFHLPRSRMALNRLGVEEVYGAYPDYYEWRDFYSINREVRAYIAYFFRWTADSKTLVTPE